MPVSAYFQASSAVIDPGAHSIIGVVVRNAGEETETCALIPNGPGQGWTRIEPSTVTLGPGEQTVANVILSPPRSFGVVSGPTPLAVRVVPHGDPDDVGVADTVVNVLDFDDRRLSLAQPVQRARRSNVYDVVLDNLGNNRASVRLTLEDASGRIGGRFEPPSLGVDPGMNEVARLKVKAKRRSWRRARSLPFAVLAAQDGHDTTRTGGTLLQQPMISGGSVGRAALAAAVAGGLVAAWFGIAKPAIDDAAERAVTRLATATTTVSTVEVPQAAEPVAATATTVAGAAPPTTAVAAPDDSEPFNERLAVTAPLAAQNVASYTVPDGATLVLTDVLIQNPNGDAGALSVLIDDEVLYGTALDNIRDLPLQLISPWVFGAGQSVSLQIVCQGVGGGSGECEVAASLSGVLRPAE